MTWEISIFIIVMLAIMIGTWIYTKKTDYYKDQYDERQGVIRGKSYKYAMWSMVLCGMVYFIITAVSGKQFAEDGVSALLIICIGAAVFSVHAIFNDSFFGIQGKRTGTGRPGVYAILLAIIIIGNGIGAAHVIADNELIKDGLLTTRCLNLVLAVLFLLVLISMGIKHMMNLKAERGEGG